jgi:hypothetical protein
MFFIAVLRAYSKYYQVENQRRLKRRHLSPLRHNFFIKSDVLFIFLKTSPVVDFQVRLLGFKRTIAAGIFLFAFLLVVMNVLQHSVD